MKSNNIIKLGRAERVPERHHHEPFVFPKGFLWGTATSAHQIEGGNDKNDWWQWEQTAGHIEDGVKSGRAAASWNRWPEDLALAKNLNLNAQRFSIEWSRIEPEEGKWDETAIEHYRDMLRAHRDAGMSIMLTIHHFTLPQWVASRGGWTHRDTVKFFVRFIKKVAEVYVPFVDFWITLNEPIIYITQAYLYGVWPPGKKGMMRLLRAFFYLTKAHRLAYRAIHEAQREKTKKEPQVGIAQNVISYSPYRRHKIGDLIFVAVVDWLWNHAFFSFTRREHDFIGVNYYFHYRIAFVPKDYGHFFFQVHREDREASALGWEINPPGIFSALQDMMIYKKPIYITENGLATTNDHKRERFIVGHLKEVYHAIKAGVDVRGYFYWSLIDNFEWDKGFWPRFGLCEVNYKTHERTRRRSAEVYAQIARDNEISHDLMRLMGHEV